MIFFSSSDRKKSPWAAPLLATQTAMTIVTSDSSTSCKKRIEKQNNRSISLNRTESQMHRPLALSTTPASHARKPLNSTK
jgi:hypothetical protein